MGDQINLPQVLCVEGKDDYHFFLNFLKSLQLKSQVDLIHVNGVTTFKDTLNAITNFDTVTTLAIICDADYTKDNHGKEKRFEEVGGIVSGLGFKCPRQYNSFATRASENEKISGIFICTAPDSEEGSIEDLILSALNQESHLCIRSFFECAKESYKNKAEESKKKLQAFLAGFTKEYVSSFGFACEKNPHPFNNFEHKNFDELKSFLENFNNAGLTSS